MLRLSQVLQGYPSSYFWMGQSCSLIKIPRPAMNTKCLAFLKLKILFEFYQFFTNAYFQHILAGGRQLTVPDKIFVCFFRFVLKFVRTGELSSPCK